MTGQSLLERCRDLCQSLDQGELPERTVTDLRFIVDKELNPTHNGRTTFKVGGFRITCKPDNHQSAWEIYDEDLDGRVILDDQGNTRRVFAVRGVEDLESKEITNAMSAKACSSHILSRFSCEIDKFKSQDPKLLEDLNHQNIDTQGAWNVKAALNQLYGMERSCKLAINDLYTEHSKVNVDAYLTRQQPLPLSICGVLSSAMVVCAWYCEVAIKAFHALVRDDNSPLKDRGHRLLILYKALEKDGENKAEGGWNLDKAVFNAVRSHQELWKIPAILERPAGIGSPARRPFTTASDIKTSLKKGCKNFVEGRFSFPEKRKLTKGIPDQMFIIGKGVEMVCKDYLRFGRIF